MIKDRLKKSSVSIIAILLIFILMALPTGYEDAAIYKGTDRVKAKVLSTSEDSVISNGLIQSGEQYCKVKILGGKFKGQEANAVNMLSGSLEADKIFKKGDVAHVVISYSGDTILSIMMSDHYRLDKEALLAGIFVLLLIGFAGKTGLRAVYSFVITILAIWKILTPAYLNGANPIWWGIALTAFLTLLIIFLVYGFDKKTLAASSGALLGVLVTCIIGCIFTEAFKIHGAAMGTMTTTLLLAYSGGYIALLMTFMAQGTPIDNILNYKYVAAELLDTIVGSFGLVTVAPFTALTSAWLLTKKKK